MKQHIQYLNEFVSKSERTFIKLSSSVDLIRILEEAGVKAKTGGLGGSEYIEFEYNGNRFEISQVDVPTPIIQ